MFHMLDSRDEFEFQDILQRIAEAHVLKWISCLPLQLHSMAIAKTFL